MDCDNLLLLEPYGLPRAEKRELFTQVLTDLKGILDTQADTDAGYIYWRL